MTFIYFHHPGLFPAVDCDEAMRFLDSAFLAWASFALPQCASGFQSTFSPSPRRHRLATIQLPASIVDESAGISSAYKAPQNEIDRRRNLAIISHPDSGKTTMTEKLLLYGGAIQQAGAVRQKRNSGQQRPISWKWKRRGEFQSGGVITIFVALGLAVLQCGSTILSLLLHLTIGLNSRNSRRHRRYYINIPAQQ